MPDYDAMSVEELQKLIASQSGKEAVPTEKIDPTGMGQATGRPMQAAKDIGRGAYQGATDAVAGTVGLPGDISNATARLGTSGGAMPFAGSADWKDLMDRGTGSAFGDVPGQPQGAIGNLTKYGTAYAPALAMPGQAARTFAGRALENVGIPAAASSAAQMATDDPRIAFAAAMLAGRTTNPFGGKNRRVTEAALRDIGAKGSSYLDKAGNKTVIPDRLREIGTGVYDPLEAKYGLKRGELPEAYALGLLSPADTKTYLEARRQYGVGSDLRDLTATGKSGEFSPKEVRDAVKDVTSPLHNYASKLSPTSDTSGLKGGGWGASIGGIVGGLAPHLLGHPEFGQMGAMGGMGLGGYAGLRVPHVAQYLPGPATFEKILGNNPSRTLGGLGVYSGPLRTEKQQ